MKHITATLHDGAKLEVEVQGNGPAILLPVNPKPIEGQQAENMRQWGLDPALGKSLIDGLADAYTVVAFDYEGHVLAHPKPDTLTPENVAKDFLAIADAAGVESFAYYGYSWLALSGLQLAIRTDRLWALMMGGYPPLDGPYKDMLKVTNATHRMAMEPKKDIKPPKPAPSDEFDWSQVEVTMSEPQTRQFVTLYEALQTFDDRKAQRDVKCPHLCFAGSADKISYSEKWDNAVVDIAGPLIRKRAELEKLGWQVHILDGLDHTQAMQAPKVLPIIKPWLQSIKR